jgi:hypothetical protein
MKLAPRERDGDGKTVKDHVLERWVQNPPRNTQEEAELAEVLSDEFDRPPTTICRWMSCWRNYKGTTFRGKIEGWPRITHSILPAVKEAIKKANCIGAK